MSSKGTYYQFVIDVYGEYIRGYLVSSDTNDRFFTIHEPTFSNQIFAKKIQPINNTIRLSKDAVFCYFEIKES